MFKYVLAPRCEQMATCKNTKNVLVAIDLLWFIRPYPESM